MLHQQPELDLEPRQTVAQPKRWARCHAVRLLYGGATLMQASKESFIPWALARALAEKHGLLRQRRTWWAA